jgi:hypothetical protein
VKWGEAPGTEITVDAIQRGDNWSIKFDRPPHDPAGNYVFILRCGRRIISVIDKLIVSGYHAGGKRSKKEKHDYSGEPSIDVPGDPAAGHTYLVSSGTLTGAGTTLQAATLIYPGNIAFDMDVTQPSTWVAEFHNNPPFRTGDVHGCSIQVVDSLNRSASKSFTLKDSL